MDQKNTMNEIGNQLHSQPNEPVSYSNQTVHSYFNVNVENYSNSSVYNNNNNDYEKTQQPTLKKHKSKHHS